MTLRGILWASVSTSAQAEDDKTSIPSQIEEGQRWAAANDVHILDMLIVPGHSRRYTRIEQCSRDMLKSGIDAFDKLMKHWDAKDFDVLIIRDGNRFARTQALHATVIEETIGSGARLFSLSDGWVDESNYRWFISMNGYMAASYIDHLIKGQKKTKTERSSRGIPTGARVVFSHSAVRNEYGKLLSIVVDESKRRLFDDVKTLLLEGVGWKFLETVLYERYGHARSDGTPFKRFFFYHLLHNPWFWGHGARFYKNIDLPNGQKTDMWVFDTDAPVPEGVQVWRHTHEAVYTGKDAEAVKAELRRRRMVIRGTARPYRTARFSGLLICEYCGYRLTFFKEKHYGAHSYVCRSKYFARLPRPGCPQARHILQRVVQQWINEWLRMALDDSAPPPFSETEDNSDARMDALQVEIAEIENQVRRLIVKQATAPDTLVSLYDEQIQALGKQVKILRENLLQAERSVDKEERHARAQALDELKAYENLEDFWKRPEVEINQWLHKFFGRWRIRVQDQQIVGVKRV